MRNKLSYFLFAALLSTGCERENNPPPPAKTQWVTSFGTNYDTVTGWTIRVDETNGIRIGPKTSRAAFGMVKFDSTISPSGWKAHPGWFAYAENSERVWMFDGDRSVLVLSTTKDDVRISSVTSESAMPAVVSARLPVSILKEIKEK